MDAPHTRQARSAMAPRVLERALPSLRSLATTQGGVVSKAQLLSLGLGLNAIERWRRRGLLVPVARRVYALPGTAVGPVGRRWAALLSTGSDACITGDAAIDGLGLVAAPPGPTAVLISRGNPRPQAGITVHRTRSLPASDVVEIDGIRYASAARAIFDRSPGLTTSRLDQVLDRAMHLGLFDTAAFDRLLREWPTSAGVTVVRAALSRLDETAGLGRTELERLLVRLIVESDLPTPAVNARVAGYEVDVSWSGTRAIVEADGRKFHTSPAPDRPGPREDEGSRGSGVPRPPLRLGRRRLPPRGDVAGG